MNEYLPTKVAVSFFGLFQHDADISLLDIDGYFAVDHAAPGSYSYHLMHRAMDNEGTVPLPDGTCPGCLTVLIQVRVCVDFKSFASTFSGITPAIMKDLRLRNPRKMFDDVKMHSTTSGDVNLANKDGITLVSKQGHLGLFQKLSWGATFFFRPLHPQDTRGVRAPRPPGHISALINLPHYGSNTP